MKSRQRIILIIIVLAGALLGLLILLFSSDDGIDRIPEDAYALDAYLDKAIISDDSGELFRALGSLDRLDFMAADLYVFAKANYAKYIFQDAPIIGFKLNSVEKNNTEVRFTGRFGASSDSIKVTANLTSKDRLVSVIEDTALGITFKDELPSNSARNIYIGSMPVNGNGYTIDYDNTSTAFTIYVYNNPDNYYVALDAIRAGLRVNDLSTEKINQLGLVERDFDNRF